MSHTHIKTVITEPPFWFSYTQVDSKPIWFIEFKHCSLSVRKPETRCDDGLQLKKIKISINNLWFKTDALLYTFIILFKQITSQKCIIYLHDVLIHKWSNQDDFKGDVGLHYSKMGERSNVLKGKTRFPNLDLSFNIPLRIFCNLGVNTLLSV